MIYILTNNNVELANLVDVRRETIIRLEKGQYNPSLQLALDIASVFQTTVEEMFMFVDLQEEEKN